MAARSRNARSAQTARAVQKSGPHYWEHLEKSHSFSEDEVLGIRIDLLAWYRTHRRKLPWRGDPPPYGTVESVVTATKDKTQKSISSFFVKQDTNGKKKKEPLESESHLWTVSPYGTWVSEVMLQQTRVETVIEYYQRWMERFPDIASLSQATEEEVNTVWAGLGYYRRARMLREGSIKVVEDFKGKLPSTVENLMKIPGIGSYTAGAIASIAFNQPAPLVDGNVLRVFSRLRAVAATPKDNGFNKLAWKLAQELVPPEAPGDFNQALMELGATLCSPRSPSCSSCPLRPFCKVQEAAPAIVARSRPKSTDSLPCKLCDMEDLMEGLSEIETKNKGLAKESVVELFPLKAVKKAPRLETHKVAVVELPIYSKHDNTYKESCYLMVQRPDAGLLASQWEFPRILVEEDAGSADEQPLAKKQKTSKSKASVSYLQSDLVKYIQETLGVSLSWGVESRVEISAVDHIFSHVRHTMEVELITLKPLSWSDGDRKVHAEAKRLLQYHRLAKDSPVVDWRTAGGQAVIWETYEGLMKRKGITKGMRKVFEAVEEKKKMKLNAGAGVSKGKAKPS